jgi:hypothetical protein
MLCCSPGESIAPNSDNDTWLKSVVGSKLSYDDTDNVLKYDGHPVSDHTFAIIGVSSAPAPNIPKLLYTSKAAWAVLALTDFYTATLPDVNSKDDVPRVDKLMLQSLAACVDQLKRELRFSAYDRALALRAFAERSKKLIGSACSAKNISATDCKTPQIDSFEDGIDGIFGVVHSDTKRDLMRGTVKFNQAVQQLFEERLQEK